MNYNDTPEEVSVYWAEPIQYLDLHNWEGEWFDVLYVFCANREPLYIGMAYGQYLHDRLENHHKLDDIASDVGESHLTISIGTIETQPGTRMSKNRVTEIENLLIYTYKPPYNEKSHKSYSGRSLVIHNSGPGNPFDEEVSTNSVDDDDWW